VISEVTDPRLILAILSNDLDITQLKKTDYLESNVLKHHSVETKAFGGHSIVLEIY